MKLPQLDIPEPVRRLARWVGYPLFALVVFTGTLYLTLPRDRIRERVETLAATALGADVTIGELGLTLFTGPGVDLTNMIIKTRPLNASDKPLRYVVDDATVHPSLLDALRQRTDVSWKAHAAGGTARGALRVNPDEGSLQLDVEGVMLQRLPGVSAAVSLPIEGALDVKVDVTAPADPVTHLPSAAKAQGQIDLACDGCVIGDGKAKLSVQGDPMLAQGITFPRLQLGKLAGTLLVEKGRATLKDTRAHSADVDIEIDGYIELKDPVQFSQLHLYLRFRPSVELVKREPTMDLMQNMLGAIARRPDGYIGFSVTGPLQSPLPLPSKDPPPGVVLGKSAPVAVSAPATTTVTAPRTFQAPPPGPRMPSRMAEPTMPPPGVPPNQDPIAPPTQVIATPPPPPPPSGAATPFQAPTTMGIPPAARIGAQLRGMPVEPAGAPAGGSAGDDGVHDTPPPPGPELRPSPEGGP